MGTVTDAVRDLRAVAARLSDMTPILRVVAQDVQTYVDDRFAAANTPAGQPWRALSPATESINPRRVGGSPLLDTGRLRASITTQVGPRSLSFGTNAVYAAAQNFGNPDNRLFGGPPAPVPSRQFLPVARDGRMLEPEAWWAERFAAIEHWLATGEIR